MEAPEDLFRNVIEEFIPFNKHLGFKLKDVKEDFASLLIPFREEMIGDPRRRSIHGGVIATAMDTVGGAAGITTFTSFDDTLSTIDLRIDYLRYGQHKDIICEGHIIKSGKRVIFTRMIAYHVDDPDTLIAEGRGVYSVIRADLNEDD